MAMLRVTCPACGPIDLAADRVALNLHPSGPRGSYRFTCTGCGHEVDRPASTKVVALLLELGVQTGPTIPEGDRLPFDDWTPDPLAPPLTLDDLIAFHFVLETEPQIVDLISRV
jgi:hypothetical protein